jgi:probable HAF family extracellular repeat protein
MINDAGEITGPAAFPNASFDGFIWRKGVATDLGHLNGDCFSEGWAINPRGQVVGNSYSCSNFHHAFLWEKGSIVDLNTLIARDSRLELVGAFAINARSEIAGMGVPPGVPLGNLYSQGHAFLLIPCDENHDDSECKDEGEGAPAPAPVDQTPINVNHGSLTPERLAALRARLAQRYHIRGFGTPKN